MVLFSFKSATDIPNKHENIIKGNILLLDNKLPKSFTVSALTICSPTFTVDASPKLKLISTPSAISNNDSPNNINTDEIKLVITNTSIESDKVIVKGSYEQLEKVAIVKALLDVDSLVEQKVGTFVIEDVELKAYDAKGNVVDVEIVPGTIDITITIESPSKEVTVKVVPRGNVAFGKAISSIETNVSKIILLPS